MGRRVRATREMIEMTLSAAVDLRIAARGKKIGSAHSRGSRGGREGGRVEKSRAETEVAGAKGVTGNPRTEVLRWKV